MVRINKAFINRQSEPQILTRVNPSSVSYSLPILPVQLYSDNLILTRVRSGLTVAYEPSKGIILTLSITSKSPYSIPQTGVCKYAYLELWQPWRWPRPSSCLTDSCILSLGRLTSILMEKNRRDLN